MAFALMLSACGSSNALDTVPIVEKGVIADRIVIDKSDRVMILYKGATEIVRYGNLKLGASPSGHKRFRGDERTPEGQYTIDGSNPQSSYHLSLRISYPNDADRAYAKSKGRSPGGDIFIHGQPNGSKKTRLSHDWTDGCIAVSNVEIEQIWDIVPDGTPIFIQP